VKREGAVTVDGEMPLAIRIGDQSRRLQLPHDRIQCGASNIDLRENLLFRTWMCFEGLEDGVAVVEEFTHVAGPIHHVY